MRQQNRRQTNSSGQNVMLDDLTDFQSNDHSSTAYPGSRPYQQTYQQAYEAVDTEAEDDGNNTYGLQVPLQQVRRSSRPSTITHATSSRATSADTRHTRSTSQTITQTTFSIVPVLPPEDAPSLNWLPISLTPTFLWANALICCAIVGCICAIMFGVGSDRKALLTSVNAHILSTYAPTLIATFNLLLFRSTFFESFRMVPYFRMADRSGRITDGVSAKNSVAGSYFPWAFASYENFWLKLLAQVMLIVVSVLTAFKAVFLGSQEVTDGWILTVHHIPAYYLIAAYCTMAIFYVVIFVWTRGRSTGLKWDPASPLDHLALVWRTDAMDQFSILPNSYRKAFEVLPEGVRWRLGYWARYDHHANGTQTQSLVHGIGTLNGSRPARCYNDFSCTCGNKGGCDFSRMLYPQLSHPAFLTPFLLMLLGILGWFIAAIVRGRFQNGYELSGSWLLLKNMTQSTDSGATMIVSGTVISASDSTTVNILFRALPTFIAGYFALTIMVGLDRRLRDTVCYADLAAGPQPSSKSLALDYDTQIAFLVPVAALKRRHYRVAWISFVATIAPLCPVFAAGLFIVQRKSENAIRLVVSKPAYILVFAYVLLFISAMIVAWPRKLELLLRPMYSIADHVKPFVDSSLLTDGALGFAVQERSQEKFYAKVLLAEHLYRLGVVEGTCGRRHRGVDIVGNENGVRHSNMKSAEELIREQVRHRKGGTGRGQLLQADESNAGLVPNIQHADEQHY